MYKLIRLIALVLVSGSAVSQPLRDINYNYLYYPDEAVLLQLNPVRGASGWTVYYSLRVREASTPLENYSIEWSTRETLSEKEGKPWAGDSTRRSVKEGVINLPLSSQPYYLVGKVIGKQMKRAWIFYASLEPNYPVNAILEKQGEAIHSAYVNIADTVVLKGISNAVVSYYNDIFPPSQPPFSEAQGKVSRGMKSDSTFSIQEGQALQFSKKGLYLIQTDTNSAEGITVRAEDDYPKFARVQTLAPPLVYITTAQEHTKLLQAKSEKRLFDKVVLGITNDQERARRLMRNYFKRIELANQLFTSYKEGWKTDRGMVYIVFGLPDEVFKFGDREVWNYKSTQNTSFTFIKSSSVFDPDNYVLLRDKKYQQAWYETIDLWRGSRF